MPKNVEIKATVKDLAVIQRLVEVVADKGPTELNQVDTFFRCDSGRLKVREFSDSPGELIYYERPDLAGPKQSLFFVSPAPDPGAMKRVLAAANGTLGVVKKRRLLYLVGQTRVHLDRVEGLGTFVELEVVLTENQTTDDGVAIAKDLMKKLDIGESHLIDKSYFDLLQEDADRRCVSRSSQD